MKRYDLKTARTRKGLSQKQLEKLSGVPQPSISRYEHGVTPEFETVLALASTLELRPEQLMFGATA